MARRMGGRLTKTSAIDLMTRKLLIGKNRRAPQKARRPKDFCLSTTFAVLERKLGRGWDIFRPGHDFGNPARPLLEVAPGKSENVPRLRGTICADFWLVGFILALLLAWASVCLADFTASDSDTLYDLYSRAYAIAEDVELIKNRSADWSYIRGHLQEIDDALSPGGDIYAKLSSIDGSASSTASRLVNIESSSAATANGISSLSDMLDSRLRGISNAIANIPRCNVVLTNYLSASGNVDMGVVTNLATYLFSFQDVADWGDFSGFPYYELLFAYFHQLWGEDYFDIADFKAMWSQSPLGFMLYLYQSALFRSSLGSLGLDSFDSAWSVWHSGDFFGMPSPDYTIFEAYNTIPLGAIAVTNAGIYLTLQGMASKNVDIYNTLQGWNNFHIRSLTNITNALNKIVGDTTIIQSSVENNTTVTESIADAIGETTAVDLDYEEEHDMPQWEPDYHASAEENTNNVLYADASRYLSESMYKDKTNVLSSIYSSFDRDPKRLNETLSFGGINPGHGHGYLGAWSMRIGFSESSSAYQELKRVVKGVFDVICFVGHLCVFFVFARRIVKFVTKPFPV